MYTIVQERRREYPKKGGRQKQEAQQGTRTRTRERENGRGWNGGNISEIGTNTALYMTV